jgi:hypothetical protein
VTCLSCHAVRAVRSDGNASLDLVTKDLVYPDDGKAETVALHRALCEDADVARAAFHTGFLETWLAENPLADAAPLPPVVQPSPKVPA